MLGNFSRYIMIYASYIVASIVLAKFLSVAILLVISFGISRANIAPWFDISVSFYPTLKIRCTKISFSTKILEILMSYVKPLYPLSCANMSAEGVEIEWNYSWVKNCYIYVY